MNTKSYRSRFIPIITVYFLGISYGVFITPVYSQEQPPEYVVENGKVDKATFNGYRRYHGICFTCHGQDAMGSTIAPSLVESLKEKTTYDIYLKTIMEGRTVTKSDGSISAMPSFKENADIMKYKDDIYRFLKARSDGVLPPGRPQKIPK